MATVVEIQESVLKKCDGNADANMAACGDAALVAMLMRSSGGGTVSCALVYTMLRDVMLHDDELRAIMREIDAELGEGGTTGVEG